MYTDKGIVKDDLVVFNKPLPFMIKDFGLGPFRVEESIELYRPKCTCDADDQLMLLLSSIRPLEAVMIASGALQIFYQHYPDCPVASDALMGLGDYRLVTLRDCQGSMLTREGQPIKINAGYLSKINLN
jgi:hypothetical protein